MYLNTYLRYIRIRIDTNESFVSIDSAYTLGLFIAARLHEIKPDQRKLCENEILKLLS